MKEEKKKEERLEALKVALSQIEKEYGRGAVMQISQASPLPVEVIPTGSLGLDIALGVFGLPRGRVVEIFGPEMSGKSSLALHVVREAQKQGGLCAVIDAEHALDVEFARKIGVRVEDLLISQPDTAEQALSIAETLIRSNAIDVVVVDSVAALVPQAEIEGEMGDFQMGLQARLMSSALRKLTGVISKSKTVAIFINQIRMKIGVFFGNPETTPGGLALKFYSSVRLDVRRAEAIKKGETIIGSRVRVKVVKNKVAPPFKSTEFDLIFNEGISREGELIDLGLAYGLLKKSGSFLIFEDKQLGQGREAAREFLKQNKTLALELEKKIKEQVSTAK